MENYLRYQPKKKAPYLIWILIGAFLLMLLLSISFGSSSIGIREVIEAIKGENEIAKRIIIYIRIPRIIAAVFVGISLSISGLLLQSMLNNSLASPGVIGINSGAALGSIVFMLFFSSIYSIVGRTLGAFIGAMLAALLVYGIARLSGASRGVIILAGIAISRLLSAISDTLTLIDPSLIQNKVNFSLGSLSDISYNNLIIVCPLIIIASILAIIFSNKLDIMALGDEIAHSLGLNVKLLNFIILLLASLLASLAVSIAGLLSFLGLICPHIIRRIIGPSNHKRLIILTAIFGSTFTLFSDLISRIIFNPYEVPVGIIMAFVGVPFFIFLLFSKGRRDRYDVN